MQKIDYYAVACSMYGLLRNKHISYRGHLLVEARRKARHQVSNFVLHRKARKLKDAVLNGINKPLEHLDKVQDGKRGAGVCKALASALAQSQNQIAKRLGKFEQEG